MTSMYLKYILLIIIFCISINDVYGQSAEGGITWQRLYDFQGYSSLGRKTQPTSDSGFITTGYTFSSPDRIFLIKQNKYGDTIWIKYYNGSFSWWVEETHDKGFIIAGAYSGNAIIIKTDSVGNVNWQKIYNNPYGSFSRCIKQTPDNGFIITLGWSDNNLLFKLMIEKTDSLGNIEWNKIYGINSTGAREIIFVNNSGYVTIGNKSLGTIQTADFYIVRIKLNGDTLWTKTIGGNYIDDAYSIQNTSDNGFIVCGWTNSFTNGLKHESYIIKLDSNGNQQWYKVFSDLGGDESYSIRAINNGFIIVGYSDTLNNACGRGKIRIIDNSGNLLKEISYSPDNECAVFWSLEKALDGGYIISGWAENGWEGVYIVKTDSLLYSTPIGINNKNETINSFHLYQNYPNPFNPVTIIKYYIPKAGLIEFKVYDIQGKEIIYYTGYKHIGEYEYEFDASNLSSGVYFYQLKEENNVITKKMLLLK